MMLAIGLIIVLALLALVFWPAYCEAVERRGEELDTRAFDVAEDGDRWRRI